jgi:hypothetical protein
VAELALVHVEAQLIGRVLIRTGVDEGEARVGVDKAADQPRARQAIDLDVTPRHPSGATRAAGGDQRGLRGGRRRCSPFGARKRVLGGGAPWCVEEVSATRLGEARTQALRLSRAVIRCRQSLGGGGDRAVLGVAIALEHSLHLIVVYAFHKARPRQRGLAAAFGDLTPEPTEVLDRLVSGG